MPSSVRILTRVPFTSKATARMSMSPGYGSWQPVPTARPGTGRSGGSKQQLRLPHQPAAVVVVDVAVARDPQQVERHVERQPCGDRLERPLAVGEMAAVLPEEMPDERLRAVPVTDGAHERMLELARDPADVEHPVPALHAFQVDRGDVQALAEQEVRRGGVAVQPDLAVLPHARSVPPEVPQPRKLVDIPLPDAVGIRELTEEPVEVPAVGIEIDGGAVRSRVVLGGQEIGQRLQPPVEMSVVPVPCRPRDRVAELLTGVVFEGEHAVDVATEPQRADHVVRRPDQLVPAQRLEPLVLLTCPSESGAVELADDLGAAGLLLVPVDLVAAGQPEGTVGRLRLAHPNAVADDPGEEVVQRVVTRDVADIFSVHREPLPLRPRPRTLRPWQATHGRAASSTNSQSRSAS